jgi:hypothetical protein
VIATSSPGNDCSVTADLRQFAARRCPVDATTTGGALANKTGDCCGRNQDVRRVASCAARGLGHPAVLALRLRGSMAPISVAERFASRRRGGCPAWPLLKFGVTTLPAIRTECGLAELQ